MLSKTATNISEKNDPSLRARRYSNDETGALVNAFNNMLNTIEKQNKTLTNVKNNYLSLYDKNPMMLFTLDINGTIISVNEYGATHLGRSVEELMNTKYSALVFEGDVEASILFLHNCKIDNENVQRKELRVIDINHKTIWIIIFYVLN